jgi:hypothetical protein
MDFATIYTIQHWLKNNFKHIYCIVSTTNILWLQKMSGQPFQTDTYERS